MDIRTVADAMARAFQVTGASTPSWPHPRPDGRPPTDAEYSRCENWGKYRILGARAEAWALAVVELGLATASDVPPPGDHRVPARAIRLEPVARDGVRLTFVLLSPEGDVDSMLEIRAGTSDVRVADFPDCGCDACDDGSEPLLDQIDETVSAAITGELVHVALPDSGHVMSLGSGFSASMQGDGSGIEFESVLADARAYPVTSGNSWLPG